MMFPKSIIFTIINIILWIIESQEKNHHRFTLLANLIFTGATTERVVHKTQHSFLIWFIDS